MTTSTKRKIPAKRLESIKRSWQQDDPQRAAEQFERLQDAAEEKSISGQLRRAIHASGQSVTRLAKAVGLEPLQLSEWLQGERNLRSDVLDRIGLAVGAQLTIAAKGR